MTFARRWQAGNTQRRHEMRPAEIAVRVEDKCHAYERTVLLEMYATNWRLVTVDNLPIGMTPFPDVSIILPFHSAGRVVDQLFKYVSADKARSMLIPSKHFIPFGGVAGVDYFRRASKDDMTMMLNWVMQSTPDASTALREVYAGDPESNRPIMALVNIYSLRLNPARTIASVVWPNIWASLILERDVTLQEIPMGPEGFTPDQVIAQPPVNLVTFKQPWTTSLTRGVYMAYKTAWSR